MFKTIKNFKWFFTVSFICLLLGVFTFITFINRNFIFLNENNLQYLLILGRKYLLMAENDNTSKAVGYSLGLDDEHEENFDLTWWRGSVFG